MQFVYPIQAILLYLSLLFAPADTERIVFHGVDRSGVLIRDAAGWNLAGPEGNTVVKLEGSRLISEGGGQPGVIDLVNLVEGAAGHDWTKHPTLSLADDQKLEAVTVEKTADGLKVRQDRGKEGIYAYTIAYVRKGEESEATCNVLGAVKQPGVVALQDGDTLRSVLLKAGGPAGKITPPIVWLLRGKPGEKLSQRESFDLAAVLEGRTGNPAIGDHVTLYVEPSVLLRLGGEYPIAVDGQPCSAEELRDRLRDRVEAGVRSATLHAHRDTPHDSIQPLFDACIAAGIPHDRLTLDTAAAQD